MTAPGSGCTGVRADPYAADPTPPFRRRTTAPARCSDVPERDEVLPLCSAAASAGPGGFPVSPAAATAEAAR
ncbi:hypothetical protein [Kitasatospora sp. NPDC018619]|uniref:hypothetical protein n=1 Tax=unclassified Kitasatospora TaxID=2633591 RepID=UPI0037A59F6A